MSFKMDRPNHLTVPSAAPGLLTLDTLNLGNQLPYSDHSPALSMKIKVPKRQYSLEDPLQRMETPMFDKQTQTSFVITGCLFVGIGLAMLIVCLILQWKNVLKFITDLNKDLYFLNMSNSYLGRAMTDIRTDLPLASH